ncbi:hypothetical protein [Photorhabdus laumondii]|uniref:hypothetical protein n=1 Tax=Photorhabdus laumondii TaxID=2218628 RepID=UPI0025B1E264|nr:hypothetical protein [Photorhabdus laumondii]
MAQGASFFSFWQTDDFGFAPRVFIGLGASLLTLSIFIIKSNLFNKAIKFIIFILPFMYSLTLISTYCNASKSQLRILSLVAANLSIDIEKYNLNDKNMVIIGKMPDSNELYHSGNENPVIFKLVQTPLHDNWSWGYRQLIALYRLPVLFPSEEQLNIAKNDHCNLKKLNSNIYYDLLLSSTNDFYVMDFSKDCNK